MCVAFLIALAFLDPHEAEQFPATSTAFKFHHLCLCSFGIAAFFVFARGAKFQVVSVLALAILEYNIMSFLTASGRRTLLASLK